MRIAQWEMRQHGVDHDADETTTRAYMRQMPAWRDHPALRED